MKKITTRTLKVIIDSGSLSAVDINEIDQWENEGGQPASSSDFLKSMMPLKKGEIFEVIGGDFHTAEGNLYFEAEIELLALP